MNQLMKKLWNDEGGFILSTEAMILWTIVVLGLIVGLAAIRDAAVTELVEVANAILAFDQSFSYSSLSLTNGGSFDTVAYTLTYGSSGQDTPGTSLGGAVGPTWYGVLSTPITIAPAPTTPNVINVVAP